MSLTARQRRLIGLALVLLSLPLHAQDDNAVTASNAALEELARLQEELESLESQYDVFDERLLPALEAIEAELEAQGQLQEVSRIQNRRLQILRVNIGLESPRLLPVLEDNLQTQIRLGNWNEVTDLLEHQRHLQVVNHDEASEAVLDAMDRLANWSLALVALQDRGERADNFLDARDLYDDMLDVAEDLFGEDDPRLVPWLYRRAVNLYHLVQLFNTDNGLAGETIDEVIRRDGHARLDTFRRPGVFAPISVFGPGSRIPVVEEGEQVGIAYLRQGLGFIDDIRDIAEEAGDAEMQAMAELYHGDFQILMERGTAVRDYRDAVEQLLESGISQERLDRVFSRPMVIPHARFFSRFADLEGYQRQVLAAGRGLPDEEALYLGEFTAWDEDLPSAPRPAGIDAFAGPPANMGGVELKIRINSRGQVSSVEVISSEADDSHLERRARRAMREVKFRPLFAEGRTRPLREAHITYRGETED